MVTRIFISSDAVSLQAKLRLYPTSATVEAEYGDTVVEGSTITLAHHGARNRNPCPCLYQNVDMGLDAIGLSHLDLDALGGVAALMGRKSPVKGDPQIDQNLFWSIAAFVDINGPHQLPVWVRMMCAESRDSVQNVVDALYAWFAYSADHRIYHPRDGTVGDITDECNAAIEALHRIFQGDVALFAAGRAFAERQTDLSVMSFRGIIGDRVILRSSEQFVNYLYSGPRGEAVNRCVAYNATTKSITISLALPEEGVNACRFVQAIWGSEAGGHAGIAGSPRNRAMTWQDAQLVALEFSKFF